MSGNAPAPPLPPQAAPPPAPPPPAAAGADTPPDPLKQLAELCSSSTTVIVSWLAALLAFGFFGFVQTYVQADEDIAQIRSLRDDIRTEANGIQSDRETIAALHDCALRGLGPRCAQAGRDAGVHDDTAPAKGQGRRAIAAPDDDRLPDIDLVCTRHLAPPEPPQPATKPTSASGPVAHRIGTTASHELRAHCRAMEQRRSRLKDLEAKEEKKTADYKEVALKTPLFEAKVLTKLAPLTSLLMLLVWVYYLDGKRREALRLLMIAANQDGLVATQQPPAPDLVTAFNLRLKQRVGSVPLWLLPFPLVRRGVLPTDLQVRDALGRSASGGWAWAKAVGLALLVAAIALWLFNATLNPDVIKNRGQGRVALREVDATYVFNFALLACVAWLLVAMLLPWRPARTVAGAELTCLNRRRFMWVALPLAAVALPASVYRTGRLEGLRPIYRTTAALLPASLRDWVATKVWRNPRFRRGPKPPAWQTVALGKLVGNQPAGLRLMKAKPKPKPRAAATAKSGIAIAPKAPPGKRTPQPTARPSRHRVHLVFGVDRGAMPNPGQAEAALRRHQSSQGLLPQPDTLVEALVTELIGAACAPKAPADKPCTRGPASARFTLPAASLSAEVWAINRLLSNATSSGKVPALVGVHPPHLPGAVAACGVGEPPEAEAYDEAIQVLLQAIDQLADGPPDAKRRRRQRPGIRQALRLVDLAAGLVIRKYRARGKTTDQARQDADWQRLQNHLMRELAGLRTGRRPAPVLSGQPAPASAAAPVSEAATENARSEGAGPPRAAGHDKPRKDSRNPKHKPRSPTGKRSADEHLALALEGRLARWRNPTSKWSQKWQSPAPVLWCLSCQLPGKKPLGPVTGRDGRTQQLAVDSPQRVCLP